MRVCCWAQISSDEGKAKTHSFTSRHTHVHLYAACTLGILHMQIGRDTVESHGVKKKAAVAPVRSTSSTCSACHMTRSFMGRIPLGIPLNSAVSFNSVTWFAVLQLISSVFQPTTSRCTWLFLSNHWISSLSFVKGDWIHMLAGIWQTIKLRICFFCFFK